MLPHLEADHPDLWRPEPLGLGGHERRHLWPALPRAAELRPSEDRGEFGALPPAVAWTSSQVMNKLNHHQIQGYIYIYIKRLAAELDLDSLYKRRGERATESWGCVDWCTHPRDHMSLFQEVVSLSAYTCRHENPYIITCNHIYTCI